VISALIRGVIPTGPIPDRRGPAEIQRIAMKELSDKLEQQRIDEEKAQSESEKPPVWPMVAAGALGAAVGGTLTYSLTKENRGTKAIAAAALTAIAATLITRYTSEKQDEEITP
jgi:hypothetical protein